tara:strand:+ start:42 stop:224 length:183 start_codon:yes stop_codon:yes gene_type:complete
MNKPFKLRNGNKPEKSKFFGVNVNPKGLISRLVTKAKNLSKIRSKKDFDKYTGLSKITNK